VLRPEFQVLREELSLGVVLAELHLRHPLAGAGEVSDSLELHAVDSTTALWGRVRCQRDHDAVSVNDNDDDYDDYHYNNYFYNDPNAAS